MSTPRTLYKKYHLFYNPNWYSAYTLITRGGNVWGCGPNVEAPAGYGGNIMDYGYKNLTEYIEEMKSNRSKIGSPIDSSQLPGDVLEWVEEIVSKENQQ